MYIHIYIVKNIYAVQVRLALGDFPGASDLAGQAASGKRMSPVANPTPCSIEREFSIGNPLIQIHSIIEMIW